MKSWTLAAAVALIGLPAAAIPPLPPSADSDRAIRAYMDAVRANDAQAYEAMLAPAAVIGPGAGDFSSPYRKTRFVDVFATDGGRSYLLIAETTDCPPALVECLPRTHVETIVIGEGRIVRLERSATFALRLDGPVWRSSPP